jgi:hypothetical protein
MKIPQIAPFKENIIDDSFANSEMILVVDHMPDCNNISLFTDIGQPQFVKNTIFEIFNNSSIDIDINSKIFIFDSYECFDDFNQAVFTNDFLIGELVKFNIELPNWNLIPDIIPDKKLTAIMNKTRPNREILSNILANFFDISEISYSSAINQIDTTHWYVGTNYKFNKKLMLPKYWIGDYYENFSNSQHFSKYLFKELFSKSAVSLITEPTFFEKGNHISEKTIMSIYSGHFLIWVGGWKAEESARLLGLDTFDDVIDHSYQYIEHPTMRCVEAIIRNLNFLNDLSSQISLREKFKNRFNDNLKLIRDINKIKNNTKMYLNNPDLYDYAMSVCG